MRNIFCLIVVLSILMAAGCVQQFRTQNLQHAAAVGSVSEVRRHLDAGADVNGKDRGWSALALAAVYGQADVVPVLIEAGAEIAAKSGGWTPLATAVHYGHDDVARLLLDAGADINSREGHPHRRTPLEIAVECQHLSTVELLLERGAALEPSQLSYWPIIVEAATRGDATIVRVLLAHGAGESPAFVQKAADHAAVNAHEAAYRLLIDHGASPTLTSVAALGYEKQVRELLEAGTDPDETGSVYLAPLHAAAGQGHVAIVRMLLDAGANPEQSTRYTALGAAAMQGQQEVVRVLVEAGADVNGVGDRGVGQPPLECAIEAEDAEMAGLLLELGADPCLKREYPWMPLEVAARLGNVEILQMLIDTGLCSDADLRVAAHAALEQDNTAAYDMLAGSGAELTLAMAAQRGDPAAVERLIAEGADVNAASESGSPPLLLASGGGHTDIVRALLSAGADVEAVDRGDGTALHYAATAGHVEVARMLIEAGAVVSVSQRFCGTPLHEAAQGGHLAMIRLLVGSGADPDARSDYWKKRPLHSAIWAPNKTETITLLVELGANPNAATDQQVTPLHEAVKAADVEATRALLAVGADPDLPNSGGNSARDLARMFDLQEIVNIIDSHD